MTYTVTSGLPLRIRVKDGQPKRVFNPGEKVSLPPEVAEQYLRLGLMTGEGEAAKPPKPKAPPKAKTPAKVSTKPVSPPKAPLTERVKNVGDVSKPSE